MNEIFKFLGGGVIGGILVSLVANYLFSKVKDKIDFSERQKEINHEFDKRLAILEAQKKMQ